MESYTRFVGCKKTETVIRGHTILADQPVTAGGEDAGPTPPELLLAALGACATHYAHEYLEARSLDLIPEARVIAEKAQHPARLSRFRVQLLVGDLEERHRLGLLRAVSHCLIHQTLVSVPKVEVEVQAGAAPPVRSELATCGERKAA
jgi:putative redox protein